MKRAQAALEYIATYGWAFMAVLITVGALAYFGAFNIDSLRGSECTFPPGFICEDYIIRSDGGGEAVVRLRNNFGVDIDTISVDAVANDNLGMDCSPPLSPVNINSEEILDFICRFDDPTSYAAMVNQNIQVEFTITFEQVLGDYPHTVRGFLSTTAQ